MVVDRDLAPVGQIDSGIIGHQAFTGGLTADCDQQLVECLFVFVLAVAVAHLDLALVNFGTADPATHANVQTLLLELAFGQPRHVAVDCRQKAVERFENHDLCTETTPYRAHLQADHASADDAQAAGYFGNFECTDIVQDVLVVDVDFGDRERHRTGGKHHVLCADGVRLAVVRRHFDLAIGEQLAAAIDELDPVGLEKLDQARIELFDYLALAFQHAADVDRDAVGVDAVLLVVVLDMVEMLGRIEQRLGRNAADIQAAATGCGLAVVILAVVDQQRLQSQLRGPDCAGIAARASADENHVEFVV